MNEATSSLTRAVSRHDHYGRPTQLRRPASPQLEFAPRSRRHSKFVEHHWRDGRLCRLLHGSSAVPPGADRAVSRARRVNATLCGGLRRGKAPRQAAASRHARRVRPDKMCGGPTRDSTNLPPTGLWNDWPLRAKSSLMMQVGGLGWGRLPGAPLSRASARTLLILYNTSAFSELLAFGDS
jgi:hypothetical protein